MFASAPAPCDVRLTVELTPDVPDLTGPAYRCHDAIEAIRRDSHVLSVQVNKGSS